MTKGLSKSRYTAFCQCPKNLWLNVNKPNEAFIDDALRARFEQGNEVGDLAMGLFGPYKEVTTKKPDGSLDLNKMCELTQQYMDQGVDNICEASFALDDHYCAVDILRRNGDGWDIYEVKSSTYKGENVDTPDHLLVYTRDIAYQKWLLEQCGVKVNGTYLVRLNKFYVLMTEEPIINDLFHVKNMDALVANELPKVASNVAQAFKVLQGDEPGMPVGRQCHKPYNCAFFDYCTGHLAEPNVFNLYRMDFERKCALFNAGKIHFEDLRYEKLNEIQKTQVDTELNHTQLVSPDDIRAFLPKLTFPLYFLDFETMQCAVPKFYGTSPYQQITFQYSLHWIEQEGGELLHTYFLGNGKDDPRRELAEKLCRDIPRDACVTAYNMSFERGRIQELADAFPDLRGHLLAIKENFVDLIEPFRKKMVYLPEMNGSFSIKHVLPALCPDDPALDYANLPGNVHNGGDAMTIYPQMGKMNQADYDAAYQALLDYCYLDTLAMVKIWEKLKEMLLPTKTA